MPKMRTSFQGLLRLLAKSLYSEPDVFVRELLQNAHDSIQLRRVYRSEPAGEIRIDVDEPARTLSFTDNGTGMDRPEIEEFLSVIGSTGTGSHARELAARDVMVATIGQFGIGLLSAFVVAERIEVYTYKPGTVQAWRWINHGGEDYQLEALPVGAQPPGTRVVVTLAPDRTAFLDGHLLRQIVRRYADFLPFPILLNGFGPINAVNAPWHESSWSDPVEQERSLTAFLSQRYSDSVLLVIPVNLSRPRSVGGLYVPARYTPGSQASGMVDLFQARMCIRPNDVALLPEWARFVRGVVDCPDLHPTAARDNVLRDEVYHTLRDAVGRSVQRLRADHRAIQHVERAAAGVAGDAGFGPVALRTHLQADLRQQAGARLVGPRLRRLRVGQRRLVGRVEAVRRVVQLKQRLRLRGHYPQRGQSGRPNERTNKRQTPEVERGFHFSCP